MSSTTTSAPLASADAAAIANLTVPAAIGKALASAQVPFAPTALTRSPALRPEHSLGHASAQQQQPMQVHVTPLGLMMLLVYVSISGLAGVTNEWTLKHSPDVCPLSCHVPSSDLQNSICTLQIVYKL